MAEIGTLIGETVEKVLETMCFSAVMGPVESGQAQASLGMGACVSFRGPSRGSVLIGCSPAGAQFLAKNFLGEEIVSDEQSSQFLLELANMICGAVVSAFGGAGQYDLSLPESVAPASLLSGSGIRCDFELEQGCLSVVVRQV
jgi:CheY-specific phosphatase CheX